MNENDRHLGRLEKVENRDVWKSESADFTPWLAEEQNLKLLAETIGIELELEAKEKNVGPFRADILCKNTFNEEWVLIENQLERTDHVHLGQLLTYAAGLQAVTIVWIAQNFTEEHRAALDWLNNMTNEHVNFFGLEIEVWRIGDSLKAPKFNVVSKPNDWNKTVAAGAQEISKNSLTPAKILQLEFWTAFRAFSDGRTKNLSLTKALPQHWMNIAIGKGGVKMAAIASLWDSISQSYDSNELRVELNLENNESKEYFQVLENEKNEIEAEIGQPTYWHNPVNARSCRIYVQKSVNLEDRDDWPAQHQWLLDNLELFYKVFAARVKSL